jgi:hypothetical protein
MIPFVRQFRFVFVTGWRWNGGRGVDGFAALYEPPPDYEYQRPEINHPKNERNPS